VADNGIGPDGGIGLWDMLSENIFITHLDLSKNPLGSSAAYLSKMETAMIDNSQIIELNLSCTDLNDDAAPYLAKIISVRL
jgi:Ran GTPase-activating protein (RanGAP) involved in mRNA processing and transport